MVSAVEPGSDGWRGCMAEAVLMAVVGLSSKADGMLAGRRSEGLFFLIPGAAVVSFVPGRMGMFAGMAGCSPSMASQ